MHNFIATIGIVSAFSIGVAASSPGGTRKLLTYPHISSAYHDVARLFSGRTPTRYDEDQVIQCWGDSLTSGYLSGRGRNWPDQLEFAYHRKTVNFGVPKETSTQVKARMLARVKPAGPENVVIWAGRNNYYQPDQVVQDIADMVASLNPDSHYLVLGIPNGDFEIEQRGGKDLAIILALNARLQAMYGTKFVPVRENLMARANPRFPQDVETTARDVVPASLRLDALHLNNVGLAVVAASVSDAMIANGW